MGHAAGLTEHILGRTQMIGEFGENKGADIGIQIVSLADRPEMKD